MDPGAGLFYPIPATCLLSRKHRKKRAVKSQFSSHSGSCSLFSAHLLVLLMLHSAAPSRLLYFSISIFLVTSHLQDDPECNHHYGDKVGNKNLLCRYSFLPLKSCHAQDQYPDLIPPSQVTAALLFLQLFIAIDET